MSTRNSRNLLFLDADIDLPAADLLRMVGAGVPVIGAPVAMKAFDAAGNRIWNLGPTLGGSGSLIKAELHCDIFQVGVHRGEYLSEEFWVCRRLPALGFDH